MRLIRNGNDEIGGERGCEMDYGMADWREGRADGNMMMTTIKVFSSS